MEDKLFLVYVNPVGVNSEGQNEYDFFFSETPETVWGEDWNVSSPAACANTLPQEDTYSVVKRLVTDVDFFCAQENTCFSMQDCIDGVICLLYYYDEDEDKYHPLKFSTPYNEVVTYLEKINCIFNEEE